MTDKTKFFDIYDSYAPLVASIVNRYCTDYTLQQDLAQEVWLHIMKQLPKYDPSKELKPWLCKVATNKIFDELRRVKRIPEIADDQIDSEYSDTESFYTPTPEDLTIASESLALIDEILCKNSKYWNAFVFRYFEGLTWEEAADRCGVGITTVKMRAGVAREMILEDQRFKVWLNS